MFSREHWQIKLTFAGFGAFLLFIGMMLSPVTAQRDKFGAIECTRLAVVDADGNERVILRTGGVDTRDEDGMLAVVLDTDEHVGGRVFAYSKDESSSAVLNGSYFAIINAGKVRVALSSGRHGGRVIANGNNPNSSASLGINEQGGNVIISGKDGESLASMGFDERGGRLEVYGKTEASAVMEINKFGNGTVFTRDKNGYQQ